MQWPIIEKSNKEVVTINDQSLINATSNDYLGMTSNQELKVFMAEAVMMHGVGATGSRRLSGNHRLFLDTEAYIADWVGKSAGIMFNSGFQMNSAIFSVLASNSTLIVADKLIHASLIDGIRHSEAQLVRFRHNDMTHLSQVLKKYAHNYDDIIIISESIFSMDGDIAPLHKIVQLKHQFNARLIIDEAHSIGLYGRKGNGWVNDQTLLREVDILLVTFGKAFGLSGAMLLSSQEIVAKMKAKCRSYIYSTALPLPIASAIQKSCEIIQKSNHLREKINQNIKQFKQIVKTNSNTQIQPIIIGDNKLATQCERALIDSRFFVRAVHHPTVPKGESRLRITLTAEHSMAQVKSLANKINHVLAAVKVSS